MCDTSFVEIRDSLDCRGAGALFPRPPDAPDWDEVGVDAAVIRRLRVTCLSCGSDGGVWLYGETEGASFRVHGRTCHDCLLRHEAHSKQNVSSPHRAADALRRLTGRPPRYIKDAWLEWPSGLPTRCCALDAGARTTPLPERWGWEVVDEPPAPIRGDCRWRGFLT